MTASTSRVLERAEHFLAVGKWPEAEAVLHSAVETDPLNEQIVLAWCNVMLRYGDVREGADVARESQKSQRRER